jgi:hypothetical protein
MALLLLVGLVVAAINSNLLRICSTNITTNHSKLHTANHQQPLHTLPLVLLLVAVHLFPSYNKLRLVCTTSSSSSSIRLLSVIINRLPHNRQYPLLPLSKTLLTKNP